MPHFEYTFVFPSSWSLPVWDMIIKTEVNKEWHLWLSDIKSKLFAFINELYVKYLSFFFDVKLIAIVGIFI